MNTNMNVDKFTDPEVVGPGTWFSIHLKAKHITNYEDIENFIKYMVLISETFPCKKCRKHIKEYIRTHPFEDLKQMENEDGEKTGMFKWAWMFHNTVNDRLGKPYVDWDTAWSMYDEEIEVCSKNCGESDHDIPVTFFSDTSNNYKNSTRDQDRKMKLAKGYFRATHVPNNLAVTYVN